MTESETTFDRILRASGIVPRYESGPRKQPKVDFDFDVADRLVFAEVKEVRHNRLDQRISSGRQSTWWGSRKGERIVRRSGKVEHTGWGGHFLDAVRQLERSSLAGNQTLAVFQCFSISADMDSTDIALFMFGYHYRITDRRMVVFRDRWDEKTLPMIAYDGFANVSGLAYIRDDQFSVFANPFARVQLDSELFMGISRCRGVFELDVVQPFHAVWVPWQPRFERLTGTVGHSQLSHQR